MPDNSFNSVIYSKNVIELVAVASEYTRVVETAGRENVSTTIGKIQKILPLLYLKITVVPEVESSGEITLEKYVSEVDYNFLQQRIMNMLGEFDDYQEVFEHDMQFSEEPLVSSISENLADIYQDARDFLIAYSTGNDVVMQEALWEYIDNFRTYWGQKLVNVMRAIHQLLYYRADFQELR